MNTQADIKKDAGEEVAPGVTMADLQKTRLVGGCKFILSYLLANVSTEMSNSDRHAYMINIRNDLSEHDRMHLVRLLLATFPADIAEDVVQASFVGEGWPPPHLMDDPMADSRFWAKSANSREIDAYSCACFEQMSPKRRGQFLEWVLSKIEANK